MENLTPKNGDTANEERYCQALQGHMTSKYAHAVRVHRKIDKHMSHTDDLIRQLVSEKPSPFSSHSSRLEFENRYVSLEYRTSRLHDWVEFVMNLLWDKDIPGARLEEMAERKLRARELELAREWNAAQKSFFLS
ncbi:MAG: hypothetical protein V4857_08860 [Pseudomonadota bacterium]